MISLKKYLDSTLSGEAAQDKPEATDTHALTMAAYGSALLEMGNCSLDACPGLGDELKRNLEELRAHLSAVMDCAAVTATDTAVQKQLRDWGRSAARHNQQTTGEVKELLIAMARTAESVGVRDQRCAEQISVVTTRLKEVASLEDLTLIRASIEQSTVELKTSIERMTVEGKAALDQLQAQVSSYQTKLDAAEEVASRDALTGARSRLCVENLIESRVGGSAPFCVAILDIDGFKKVNDAHGHLTGDELLKQFATELRSVCRQTDTIGRWGGDEFILVLDCGLQEASAQIERLRKWVCGNYTLRQGTGTLTLRVDASIGLAEHQQAEGMKELLSRADAAMYACKEAARASGKAR
jgi:diguanylate cyclase (GGDEF)-like protein